ncbi:MAG TPA: ASKHA domain-containing protein, partial [Symbiobacteriaceae bacterium]|nr:ASKHA domain-containing protein [Symbiobacteriaceae bacterium]
MSFTVKAAGRTLTVEEGARLSHVLNRSEVYVETPCGARGYCRKCLVKLLGAAPPPTPADLEQLSADEIALGYRLSCQLQVAQDLEVAIIPAAMADTKKAAMGRLTGPVAIDPWAPLNAAGRSVGFALDVGTTSMVGALLDLRTGEELAAESRPNPQAVHGADLMSRLGYAGAAEENAFELQTLVTGAARQMLERLRSKAGVKPHEVTAATLVGNTVMHHLFLGLDTASLAVAPYRPTVLQGYMGRVTGLPPVYALPNIAGFVGADAVAAGLAAGLDQGEQTVLLVDIGTNGEMLLRHRGQVYACSAPAGPAFEGGEISQGMRANPGAIETVTWDGSGLQVGIIPGAPPRGICGSGLLDAVAALRAGSLLDWMGRLVPGASVDLAPGVALTQKDIRALQLAKGAIRSGIDVLLQAAGVAPRDLDAILLAGAF